MRLGTWCHTKAVIRGGSTYMLRHDGQEARRSHALTRRLGTRFHVIATNVNVAPGPGAGQLYMLPLDPYRWQHRSDRTTGRRHGDLLSKPSGYKYNRYQRTESSPARPLWRLLLVQLLSLSSVIIMASGFPVTDGVTTFLPPPDGYEVDFQNPQGRHVLDHYLIFAILGTLALVCLVQRIYTKHFITGGLKVDDCGFYLWKTDPGIKADLTTAYRFNHPGVDCLACDAVGADL